MANKVYEIVTQQIIKKLEEGVVPWRMPFHSAAAVNWKTQKAYRGINTMLLQPGEYATFNQIKEAGGKIKKGEKSHLVVFWKMLDVQEKENGTVEEKKVPMMRYYRVFEINSQVEGLESKRKEVEEFDHDPIERCEAIKTNFFNGPEYTFVPGGAYYKPFADLVNVPPMKEFEDINEYYSVLYHEMIHSTGHTSRLNREGITSAAASFGSETYSKEELVAEMGASMLCATARIETATLDNSASYIQSWLRQLKDDHTLVVKAAQQAQRAADHILGVSYDN